MWVPLSVVTSWLAAVSLGRQTRCGWRKSDHAKACKGAEALIAPSSCTKPPLKYLPCWLTMRMFLWLAISCIQYTVKGHSKQNLPCEGVGEFADNRPARHDLIQVYKVYI